MDNSASSGQRRGPDPAASSGQCGGPDPAALLTLSYGLYVVGSRKGERLNAQISNALVQVAGAPDRVAVAINKTEFTHECISESGAFAVTVLSEEAPLAFIGRFGFTSGRSTDKFEGVSHELAPSGSPFPTQYALAYMDLRVVGSLDAGSHTVFLGELEDARLLGRGRPMTYAYYREVLRGKTPPTAPTSSVSGAARAVLTRRPAVQSSGGQRRALSRPRRDVRTTAVSRPRQVGTLESDGDGGGRGMKKYVCTVCGYVYDPEKGDPESGVEPGIRFEDLPDDWVCPVCGAAKSEFELIQE